LRRGRSVSARGRGSRFSPLMLSSSVKYILSIPIYDVKATFFPLRETRGLFQPMPRSEGSSSPKLSSIRFGRLPLLRLFSLPTTSIETHQTLRPCPALSLQLPYSISPTNDILSLPASTHLHLRSSLRRKQFQRPLDRRYQLGGSTTRRRRWLRLKRGC